MKSFRWARLITASLLLLPGLSAQASVDSILRVDLKCYIQQSTSSKGPYDFGQVRLIRLNSNQLIILAGKAAGINFRSDVQLKASVDGNVTVVDSKGNVLADITQFIRVKLVPEEKVFDGKVNRATGLEASRNYFPVALIINLPGLQTSVEGIGTENFSTNPPDRDGIQISIGTINCNVNFKGAVDDKLAYFDGSLIFNGRQAVISH